MEATADSQEQQQIYHSPGRQQNRTTTITSIRPSPPEPQLEYLQFDLRDHSKHAVGSYSLNEQQVHLERTSAAANFNSTAFEQLEHTQFSSLPNECLSHPTGVHLATQSPMNEGSAQASPTISATSFGCNDTQLALMDIRAEELNFSEIKQVWLVKSWQEILFRAAFVVPIVLLGLLGNSTIIYSMCRFKQIRSKPTNIFILNMALADLLTTIVCPNAALLTDIYQFYVLGAFVCRTEGFIKITCLLVSAYSLIVLSFDWFLSVVKPCRTRIGIKQAWLTLVSIWMISIMMAAPLLFSRVLRERQWKDLVEVWCCELIQYTKYYWVCITLFLIYLPTFVMTIVLIVILAQMDRFEAKLRRSPYIASTASRAGGLSSLSGRSSTSMMRSWSFSTALDTNTANHHQANRHSDTNSGASLTTATNVALVATTIARGPVPNVGRLINSPHNSSISISMKYRRRIVKILFFYLLTSIVCWTPLQFTIIYRHFRSEAVPADWFFELTFFSQLSASLSAAMNPIIFGFLSQPFRHIVVKSWMFRLLDKLLATNTTRGAKTEDGARIVAGEHQMSQMKPPQAVSHNQQRQQQNNHNPDLNLNRNSGFRAPHEQPKLTIGSVERQANSHHASRSSHTFTGHTASRRSTDVTHHYKLRPRSSSIMNHHHHLKHAHHQRLSVQRSNSSMANGAEARQVHSNHSKRVSFKRTSGRKAGASAGVPNLNLDLGLNLKRSSNGFENGAYVNDNEPDNACKQPRENPSNMNGHSSDVAEED